MAINATRSYTTTGFQVAVPMNRHGDPQFSIAVQVGATGTYTLQSSVSQINRTGVTAIWNDIPSMTGLTAGTFQKITNSPLEAMRLNITAITGTIDLQIMQNT